MVLCALLLCSFACVHADDSFSKNQLKSMRRLEGSCACTSNCNTMLCPCASKQQRCQEQDLARGILGCACGGEAPAGCCQKGFKREGEEIHRNMSAAAKALRQQYKEQLSNKAIKKEQEQE